MNAGPFEDLPVIGALSRVDAAAKLRELGSLRFKIAASTFLDRKIIQETRLRG